MSQGIEYKNPETSVISGAKAEIATRPDKVQDLINITNMINEVKLNVRDLKQSLGVMDRPIDATKQDVATMDNLVDVLNHLPDIIRRECSEIHAYLEEMRDDLR